eukprot:GABV01002772.1.p1 GENE.GABV01002772.1~~GABV01002772.1.p1  ORF type:complete len:116 (-),score=24.46 GABV01002772.1:140-487(-)
MTSASPLMVAIQEDGIASLPTSSYLRVEDAVLHPDSTEPVLIHDSTFTCTNTEAAWRLPWSPGAIRMLSTPNLGGNSDLSEALSYEFLFRLLGAQLVKTETEIEMVSPHWKRPIT